MHLTIHIESMLREGWSEVDQVIVCAPQSLSLAHKIRREEGGEVQIRRDCPRGSVYTMSRATWLASR